MSQDQNDTTKQSPERQIEQVRENAAARSFYLSLIGLPEGSSTECDEAAPLICHALNVMIDNTHNNQHGLGVDILQTQRAHRYLRALQMSWQMDPSIPREERANLIHQGLIKEGLLVESNTTDRILRYVSEGENYLLQSLLGVNPHTLPHNRRTTRAALSYSLFAKNEDRRIKGILAKMILTDTDISKYHNYRWPFKVISLREMSARFLIFSYVVNKFNGLILDGDVELDQLHLPPALTAYLSAIGYSNLGELLSGRREGYLEILSTGLVGQSMAARLPFEY